MVAWNSSQTAFQAEIWFLNQRLPNVADAHASKQKRHHHVRLLVSN
jgi:hypothetical protein